MTRIQLCGRLSVEIDGVQLSERLRGRQVPLLLAYLVLNRDRHVGREELIGALWPDHAPVSQDAALRTLLSRLRSALGAATVAGRDELILSLPEPVWIDVEAAAAEVARALEALERGDVRRAWALAQVPLNIASRGLLPGSQASWLEAPRRELEEVHLLSLEVIGRAGLAMGGTQLQSAERAARTLIESEPYRESGYVLLMEALAARGNVAEAHAGVRRAAHAAARRARHEPVARGDRGPRAAAAAAGARRRSGALPASGRGRGGDPAARGAAPPRPGPPDRPRAGARPAPGAVGAGQRPGGLGPARVPGRRCGDREDHADRGGGPPRARGGGDRAGRPVPARDRGPLPADPRGAAPLGAERAGERPAQHRPRVRVRALAPDPGAAPAGPRPAAAARGRARDRALPAVRGGGRAAHRALARPARCCSCSTTSSGPTGRPCCCCATWRGPPTRPGC